MILRGHFGAAVPLSNITQGGGPCISDLDCMLNGLCVRPPGEGGHCACNPQWTSRNCGMLKLLPAKLDNGHRSSNSSSWGGQIVKSSNFSGHQLYSLYLSVLENNCGLKSWTSNSFIARWGIIMCTETKETATLMTSKWGF